MISSREQHLFETFSKSDNVLIFWNTMKSFSVIKGHGYMFYIFITFIFAWENKGEKGDQGPLGPAGNDGQIL